MSILALLPFLCISEKTLLGLGHWDIIGQNQTDPNLFELVAHREGVWSFLIACVGIFYISVNRFHTEFIGCPEGSG